jgi:hypothetical protein
MKALMITMYCMLSLTVLHAQEKNLEKNCKHNAAGKYDKALKICDKNYPLLEHSGSYVKPFILTPRFE